MLLLPTPMTLTGPPPTAPAARKYDADDASPSTTMVPGLTYRACAGLINRLQPSRSTSTPKRRIRFSVISTYGLEINSPVTSSVTLAAASRSAINQALTDLLD